MVGQKVWLEGTNLQLAQPSSKLGPRQYGPFVISKVISPIVYRLELPASWKIFPTFHASLLSPYHEMSEHGANYLEPPPDVIKGQEEYEVEEVLGQRTYGRGKKKQYLIKWKGYSAAHNSWEDASGVHAPELMREFLQGQQRSTRIATLKAGLGIVQPPMPSGSSAPSLPSPELYSLEHFLWYDGSTHTSPSPEEGDHQPRKTPNNVLDDDEAENYYTTPSTPATPKPGASGLKDPAQPEAEEDTGQLQYADMARPAQDIPGRGASSLLPQRAPPRDRLSPLSAFDTLHGVGGSVGGDHSYSERPSSPQEGSAESSGVDRQLPGVAGEANVNSSTPPSPFLSYPDYSPTSHDAGDALFDHADTTMD